MLEAKMYSKNIIKKLGGPKERLQILFESSVGRHALAWDLGGAANAVTSVILLTVKLDHLAISRRYRCEVKAFTCDSREPSGT